MKTETDNIIKARKLLESWYDGSAATADEVWLRGFFATAGTLPDDLEAERGMFLALDEVAGIPVSMPQEHADRLEHALDAEMRRGHIWKRRRTWISAAACLLAVTAGVFMTRYLTETPRSGPDSGMAVAAGAGGIDTLPLSAQVSAGNVNGSDTAVLLTYAPAATRRSEPRHVATTAAKTPKKPAPPTEEEQTEPGMYLCAMTDEEREMEAKGYRVVRSEMEAKAVVGLVMAKMQGNVVESSFRISDITEDLDRIEITDRETELSI